MSSLTGCYRKSSLELPFNGLMSLITLQHAMTDLKKIEILDRASFEADPSNLTIILREEDHTLGNSLKHILCRMPDVEFCGYNVPHPLEDKILFRLQMKPGVPAGPVLIKGLQDLKKVFAHTRLKFSEEFSKWREQHPIEVEENNSDSDRMES